MNEQLYLTDIFRNKSSFKESLSKAQKLGYAEADPAFDIEGTDVAHKLVILSSMITKTFPKLSSLKYQESNLFLILTFKCPINLVTVLSYLVSLKNQMIIYFIMLDHN